MDATPSRLAWLLLPPMLLSLGACASLDAASGMQPRASCAATAGTLESPAGQEWLREQGWRFADRERAAAEYERLVEQSPPWPDWLEPRPATLPPGTRFQMAIGGAQTPEQPGAFGTFDNIDALEDVREGLAVKQEWKPRVDRVVIYEVTQPLPVNLGPVGPQVDPATCRLLAGRWSQLQMLVPAPERIKYLKVVTVRPLR